MHFADRSANMRAGWKKIVILQIIVFVYFACEPSPKILPIGDYEIIKLVDMERDVNYPYFKDENTILFYERSHFSPLNYIIWQVDTLGNATEVFNDQSFYMIGHPQLNETCSLVAYTAGEYISVVPNDLDLKHLYLQTSEEIKTQRTRLLRSDVCYRDLITGETKQLTHNGHSHLIQWIGNDALLIEISSQDTAVLAQTDRRIPHSLLGASDVAATSSQSVAWSLGYEVIYVPLKWQIVSIQNDSILYESHMHYGLFPSKELDIPFGQQDIIALRDSLEKHAFVNDSIMVWPEHKQYYFGARGKDTYSVLWFDTTKIFVAREFIDKKDRFREKFDLIAVDLKTYEWKTIVERIPKYLISDISISSDFILTADGKYRIGKISYEGDTDPFLRINESVGVRGISASPSSRLFAVSAWVGKDGYNIYLIRRKDN